MEKKKRGPVRIITYPNDFRQGTSGEPFPLGVYPVFDDDLPRDDMFENFAAPDLRDLHPYPWGLE